MSNPFQKPPQSNRHNILEFDEFVAVVVALSAIGLILWWGGTRRIFPSNFFSLGENDTATAGDTAAKQADGPDSGLADSGLADSGLADSGLADSDLALNGNGSTTPASNGFTLFREQASNGGATNDGATDTWNIAAGLDLGDMPANGNSLFSNNRRPLLAVPNTITSGDEATDTNNDPFERDDAQVPLSPADDLPNLPTGNNPAVELVPPLKFNDVPNDHWAASFIDVMTARQMMAGYNDGTFRPEVAVTRAELASQIAAAFPAQSRQSAIAFSDVTDEYWASNKIQYAVETGFMKGYPEGDFQPEQAIPRVQVLVALVSGLGLEIPADADAIVSRYEDADEIPVWAVGQIAAATEAGLVVNYPNLNQLNPNTSATRAEVAAMMNRALVFTGQLEDQPSAYVVK